MEDIIENLVMQCSTDDQRVRENVYREMSHGVMVSNLSVAVARELAESEEFINKLRIAGVLHDIGKLRLNRYLESGYKDKLVVEQMRYVREHSSLSGEILEENGYPEDIVKAVRYHHENFDGSGYPEGLKGEDIPYMSRIIRTCDVFSALTTDRSYRRAFDSDTAVSMMIDEITNYDMKVFLAFQRVYHSDDFKKLEILNVFPDRVQQNELRLFIKEA